MSTSQTVGVIGAGSFGTTVATLISRNRDVLLFSRNEEVVHNINSSHRHRGYSMPEQIAATDSLGDVCQSCQLIFAVVPSQNFRQMAQDLASHLRPYHIVIHGTKGFDVVNCPPKSRLPNERSMMHTMSQVLTQETSVVRVGCLSGPNLHAEIMQGLPAASVIASRFNEVIEAGHAALNSSAFKIYGSENILGTEIAGALKNTIALGGGIAHGLGMGKNIEAFLITRGLREMVIVGQSMGADVRSYLGLAGIGDLIVSGTSPLSRNYDFGIQLAKGKSPAEIRASSNNLVEGVRTVELVHAFAQEHDLELPLMDMLYSVIFQKLPISQAISYLLEYPFALDVDFL